MISNNGMLRDLCDKCETPHLGNLLYLRLTRRMIGNPNYDAIGFASYFVGCNHASQSQIIKLIKVVP